jgi:hypothetical protein
MAYEVFPFKGFGNGLDLESAVDAIDPASSIDCMNVEFTEKGAVKQREGYTQFTNAALTNPVQSVFGCTIDGTKYLLAGCGTRLEAMGVDGVVDASQTGLTDAVMSFARISIPADELVYCGNGTDLLHTWNGSAFASIANSPKAGALAVMGFQTSGSNRMVASKFSTTTGGPSGGTTNPSRVHFSDPGAPSVWTAANYVDLTPGDGESIQNIIAWREFVFVFKESKYFVFTGESVQNDGTALFNYYTVDTGKGLVSPRAVCADQGGVYFLSTFGIQRTVGGEPRTISNPIEPIFNNTSSSFYQGGNLNHTYLTSATLACHQEKIYFSYTIVGATTNSRTMVYDVHDGWWSVWDLVVSDATSFAVGAIPELVFGYASGTNDIGRMNAGATNDDAVAISSRWRSGWSDFDMTETKKVRQMKGWGQGVARVKASVDYGEATAQGSVTFTTTTTPQTWADGTDATDLWGDGTDNSLTWGPDPASSALAGKTIRVGAVVGTLLNVEFTNSTLDQNWAMHRFELHIPAVRQPAVV